MSRTKRFEPSDHFPAPPEALLQGAEDGPPLVVVVGPTGVGKSELALALAEQVGGAIISADSRQIYADFDIGTAKPTAEELARVPHELVGTVDPRHTYTVAEYQAAAREAIAAHWAAGRLPFLVGGTGLYVRAVLDGLTIPPAPPNPALRAELERLPDLHAALRAVDPVSAERLHPNDRVRVVRALEVFHQTGKPIGHFQHTTPCPYRVLLLGVGAPRALLNERIDARVGVMLERGFLAEVAGLAERYGWDLPLLSTLGYAEMGRHLRGECDLASATAEMALHTRQYAKRQLTWFRADSRTHWLVREPDFASTLAAGRALLERWALAEPALAISASRA